MTDTNPGVAHRELVLRYWSTAQSRNWTAFAATLSPDVVYRMPQSRELIRGRERYVAFNSEYPGDWQVVVDLVIADADGAVSSVTATTGPDSDVGLSFFTFDPGGDIASVTDYWPGPSEPRPGREHLTESY